ncbi:uncharacterized protein MONOS_1227 [Monocercomonoides exilis]|uniref:uncharacterized protein n=1 Tax=Monocercomonoides exilis TaxID=2049356 RepID=UPI0035599942|nr:hypothetical protein MONOS_1227 [Monocercomonoides exilis]|eukprot:MONOS_1227.1-p1 / transcript=MONOS_1227.1 / gene=MONOS_1227 / organism=Monocercomonoides_exilis_PA203 / gene_product=unspecified product / transcript_product=unspecified product / location=Mono_scaffold00021:33197-35790(-) / protein_length=733 / sequence_SO=supercontig / SO=protein_coding / is_pseudo=false
MTQRKSCGLVKHLRLEKRDSILSTHRRMQETSSQEAVLVQESIVELFQLIKSPMPSVALASLTNLRKLITSENREPLHQFVKLDPLSHLLPFLHVHSSDETLYEVVWMLIAMTYISEESTRHICYSDACPKLYELIKHTKNEDLISQIIQFFGNIVFTDYETVGFVQQTDLFEICLGILSKRYFSTPTCQVSCAILHSYSQFSSIASFVPCPRSCFPAPSQDSFTLRNFMSQIPPTSYSPQPSSNTSKKQLKRFGVVVCATNFIRNTISTNLNKETLPRYTQALPLLLAIFADDNAEYAKAHAIFALHDLVEFFEPFSTVLLGSNAVRNLIHFSLVANYHRDVIPKMLTVVAAMSGDTDKDSAQILLRGSALPFLLRCLQDYSTDKDLLFDTCFTLSNITATDAQSAREVCFFRESVIMHHLAHILTRTSSTKIVGEVVSVCFNIVSLNEHYKLDKGDISGKNDNETMNSTPAFDTSVPSLLLSSSSSSTQMDIEQTPAKPAETEYLMGLTRETLTDGLCAILDCFIGNRLHVALAQVCSVMQGMTQTKILRLLYVLLLRGEMQSEEIIMLAQKKRKEEDELREKQIGQVDDEEWQQMGRMLDEMEKDRANEAGKGLEASNSHELNTQQMSSDSFNFPSLVNVAHLFSRQTQNTHSDSADQPMFVGPLYLNTVMFDLENEELDAELEMLKNSKNSKTKKCAKSIFSRFLSKRETYDEDEDDDYDILMEEQVD